MQNLMKSLTLFALGAASLAVTPAVPSAQAQNQSTLTVQIPFEFVARNRTFPAGSYSFTSRQGSVNLSSADGKVTLMMPVITSLARSSSEDDHLLAFDKVEGKKVLSEVWLPRHEGALVFMEKTEHTHELIRIVSAAKR